MMNWWWLWWLWADQMAKAISDLGDRTMTICLDGRKDTYCQGSHHTYQGLFSKSSNILNILSLCSDHDGNKKFLFFFSFFEWYKKDLSSNGVFNEIKMKKTEVYLVNWVASMLRIRKNWGNRALHRKWCWRYQVERQVSWRSCGRMIQIYGRILCMDWEQSRFPGSNVSTRVISPRWEKHFLSSYFCPFSLFSEVSVLLFF